MNYTDTVAKLPSLKSVIAAAELSAKKSLGQNFILDESILDSIVAAAFSSAENPRDFEVIEIGAGPGGLTRAILKTGVKKLTVIEKDNRCISLLQQIQAVYPDRLEIKEGDALEIKAQDLGTAPKKIIANLPYNISTVLLTEWLQNINRFSSLTLMFQKEVADRLTATPSNSLYGRLSVMSQAFADVCIKMILAPEVFTPSPKVFSALVHIVPKKQPCPVAFTDLEQIVKSAFLHRRKMLKKSLSELGDVAEICSVIGVENTRRPENLSVQDFINITSFLKGKK